MIQPSHHFGHGPHHASLGQGGAVDHDHRQAQDTRRDQLGLGPHAARILGDDMADPMRAQKLLIVHGGKRPARQNHRAIWQRRLFGRIDQPQQIVMRAGGKSAKVLLANRQENPRRDLGQRGNRGIDINHMQPSVARLCAPFRALQANQPNPRNRAGRNGIAAHLTCKGMGCIDHCADLLGPQVIDQALYATKAANPRWQGLGDGGLGAPRIGKHRIGPNFGEGAGQRAGLAGAAKDKAARHV